MQGQLVLITHSVRYKITPPTCDLFITLGKLCCTDFYYSIITISELKQIVSHTMSSLDTLPIILSLTQLMTTIISVIKLSQSLKTGNWPFSFQYSSPASSLKYPLSPKCYRKQIFTELRQNSIFENSSLVSVAQLYWTESPLLTNDLLLATSSSFYISSFDTVDHAILMLKHRVGRYL